jgi:hypothetical protein
LKGRRKKHRRCINLAELKELFAFLFNRMLEYQIQPKMIIDDINNNKTSFFIEVKNIIDEFVMRNTNINYLKKDNIEKLIFAFLFRRSNYLTDGLFECKYYEGDEFNKKCSLCKKMTKCPYILYQTMVRNDIDKLIIDYFGIYGYNQFSNKDSDELYQYYYEEIYNKMKTNVEFVFKQ